MRSLLMQAMLIIVVVLLAAALLYGEGGLFAAVETSGGRMSESIRSMNP